MAHQTSNLQSSEASSLQLQMEVLRQEFNELKTSIGCSHSHKVQRVDMGGVTVYRAGTITRIDIKGSK